jgi:hypothetical protein
MGCNPDLQKWLRTGGAEQSMSFWNIVLLAIILSPLWLIGPVAYYFIRRYRVKNSNLHDPGSNIGISANYWAGY